MFLTEEDMARLEEKREELRQKGRRLSFDCFNLKVRGDRVICCKHPNVNLSLDRVLKGYTAPICFVCLDYDDVDKAD